MRKLFIVLLPLVLVLSFHNDIYLKIYRIREPKFVIPIDAGSAIYIRRDAYGSGEFGAHRNGGRRHKGIDLYTKTGSPVYAGKSGFAFIGYNKRGMGKFVLLKHPDGYSSIYGHLSKIEVQNGRWVRQADVIGRVGKTGNARPRAIKPHLHFEIRLQGMAVDPLAGHMDTEGISVIR